jgi:prepilin-type processing-associated H-X9-DG protein
MGGQSPWFPAPWIKRKFSELISPSPSQTFTFIDSHPTTTVDSAFVPAFINSTFGQDAWTDLPGEFHNRGGNLSFADGHQEHWRWRFSRMGPDYKTLKIWPVLKPDDLADFQRIRNACPPKPGA